MIVYCTVPSAEVGTEIARDLVEAGLCACVNRISGVTSTYIYDGALCEDAEELLIIKTLPSHYERLEARILELHPYDLPEIVATEITAGSSAYMQWLSGALR